MNFGGAAVAKVDCQISLHKIQFADVHRYLEQVIANVRSWAPQKEPDNQSAAVEAAGSCGRAAEVFEILSRREFCYLSKTRASTYRERIEGTLESSVAQRAALAFFYDIGGGYHAGTDPADPILCFDVGLAELLVLNQIVSFDRLVRSVYPPGVRFSLVIDNLCALLVNDVPLAQTCAYVARLRRLIDKLGLAPLVEVLVESEHFTPADYEENAPVPGAVEISPRDVENVSRFLGRRCSVEEARERVGRYQSITQISEARLETIIPGVHMTQRATPTTFGFRAFAGGDSRIQAGTVGLKRNRKSNLQPVLITSRSNAADCVQINPSPKIAELVGPVLFLTESQA